MFVGAKAVTLYTNGCYVDLFARFVKLMERFDKTRSVQAVPTKVYGYL
jgi:hypothetical protein